MDLSLIIPTYNGAHKLPSILEALQVQTYSDFELIVVIDGSQDQSLSVLETYRSHFSHLRVLERENGGRSVSRNHGARTAKGDLLVFFDDDMRPQKDTLKAHWEFHQEHPQHILVGAQMEEMEKMKTEIQKYKAFLSRKWSANLQEGRVDPEKPYLTAAHFSIPKSLFFRLEGFDEQLRDAEDFDLAVRATEAKVPIYFDPQLKAWHDDFISLRQYILRQRQYTAAHQKLKMLKPDLYTRYNQFEAAPLSLIKKWGYTFFSQEFWLKSIEKETWMQALPRKLRYRIYDWVITGYGVHFPNKKI